MTRENCSCLYDKLSDTKSSTNSVLLDCSSLRKKSQRALAKSSAFPMVPHLLRMPGSSLNSGFSLSPAKSLTVWIYNLNTDKIQVMARCQETTTTTTGLTHQYLAEGEWLWPDTHAWNRSAIPSLGITIPYVEQLNLSAEAGKATFYENYWNFYVIISKLLELQYCSMN